MVGENCKTLTANVNCGPNFNDLKYWLGGLDSNQDSQSQSLESYQLDDLPAGEQKGIAARPALPAATIHPYQFNRDSRGRQPSAVANEGCERLVRTFTIPPSDADVRFRRSIRRQTQKGDGVSLAYLLTERIFRRVSREFFRWLAAGLVVAERSSGKLRTSEAVTE
jgi:hypothetical protein